MVTASCRAHWVVVDRWAACACVVGRARGRARSSWANVIDAVLEQQRSQLAAAGQEPPAGPAAESCPPAFGFVVPPAPVGKGDARREASLAGWLRRRVSGSFGRSGSRASSIDAAIESAIDALAQEKAPLGPQPAAASQPDGGAAAAAAPAGEAKAHPHSSPLRVASLAASASQSRGLAAAAGGIVEPAASPPQQPLSRVDLLRSGLSFNSAGGSMTLTLFPDTTQGRMAQASREWAVVVVGVCVIACRGPPSSFDRTYEAIMPCLPLQQAFFSFMFLCEELREQLEDLHEAVAAALRKLPA